MTLPKMKIWTGGDREYSERVQRALFELGVRWMTEDIKVRAPDAPWLMVGFLAEEKLSFDPHGLSEEAEGLPAYRLAPNGNLVPQEADDEGWIAWHGGECPVDPCTMVEVVTADIPWKTNDGDAGDFLWDRYRPDQIIRYRVPSMVFKTSQQHEREPVHQMQHGDYILREDIPDEATFQRVCEVLEGQGVKVVDAFGQDPMFDVLAVDRKSIAAWYGHIKSRRVTLSDLGITTDTQEADMSETLTEAQALREVAQGYEDGDDNPWNRIQYKGDYEWQVVDDGEHFMWCMRFHWPIRRRPRTRRIEGEISEDAVKGLERLRRSVGDGLGWPHTAAALDEILSAVEQ